MYEGNYMHFLEFTQSTVTQNFGTLHQKCNVGGIYESIIIMNLLIIIYESKDLTFPLKETFQLHKPMLDFL